DEQLRACCRHLVNRLTLRRGPNAAARAAVAARVDDVLRRAAANGANGAVPLDVCYLEERLRRWGTSAEQADTLIPLLTPEFVQAALWLTPEQRKTNALHRAVIARMIPQWADVPFYGHSDDGT